MSAPPGRAEELRANLRRIQDRIAAAAADCGRSADGITLIAVTKTFPAADVALLEELGVRDFGENRDQEARTKVAAAPRSHWHFIGQLQRNKVRSVASYADVIHSLDRPELAAALDRAAGQENRRLGVFVQVSLDSDEHRGGVEIGSVTELAQKVNAAERLTLLGLMTVPPLGVDADTAYSRCAGIRSELQRIAPGATAFSAGMSGDLEIAIRNGATHVRVGTALLGGRERLLR